MPLAADQATSRPFDQFDRNVFSYAPSQSPKWALRRPIESAQYCSYDYQRILDRHGFIISMSGKGNCYDNAMVETLFKTIKSELIWRTSFQSRFQAENAIARYIDGFYNPVRRHSALGYKSPINFEHETNQGIMALH